MTIVVHVDAGQPFVDMQDAVLGNDFDADVYRDQAKRYINDALADIARRGALPALEFTETVTAAATVPLPEDIVRLTSIHVDDPRVRLEEVSMEEFDTLTDATGVPRLFAEYQGVLYLFPAPSGSLSLVIRYRAVPQQLVVDDALATASLPSGYEHMLVAFARSRLFAFEDDVQMSQFWMGEYERMLGLLKADVGRRNLGRVRRIPGMWHADRPITFQRP